VLRAWCCVDPFETTAFTGPLVIQLREDSVGFRRSQTYLIDSFSESCKVIWSLMASSPTPLRPCRRKNVIHLEIFSFAGGVA
jgi:hypothetical protein